MELMEIEFEVELICRQFSYNLLDFDAATKDSEKRIQDPMLIYILLQLLKNYIPHYCPTMPEISLLIAAR